MGGLAVPNVRRVQAEEYHAIGAEVEDLIRKTCADGCRINVIPGYRDKENFGDIDLLIDSDYVNVFDWKDSLYLSGVTTELFTNGKKINMLFSEGRISFDQVYSFAYKGVQVDCVFIEGRLYEAAYNYFAWNDLGNLLGKTVHKFGVKLGHKGLQYAYRPDNDHLFETIEVSTDWSKILPAFGWDYERYQEGFNNLEDIFMFVASSYWFKPETYLLENLNATARIRDKKRKTYQEFLKWCERKPTSEDCFPFFLEKSLYLPWLFGTFPDFREKYELAEGRYREHCLVKSKFNGELVRKLTGLEDKELGSFMKEVRGRMGSNEYELKQWILNHSEAEIGYLIGVVHRVW